MRALYCFLFSLLTSICGYAADIDACPDFTRVDPQGAIVGADMQNAAPCAALYDSKGVIRLRGARGGYVSFHLVAKVPEGGRYSVQVRWKQSDIALETDLFREWFHFISRSRRFCPDALVPVHMPYRSVLPEPDNKVDKQTAQSFWVDIYIPPNITPGVYSGEAVMEAAGKRFVKPIALEALAAVIPSQESVTVDHNCYGTAFLAQQYPELRRKLGDSFFASKEFFGLIHAYHRIFYEHLGTFHQLGYGHGGKVGPEFAPALTGSGRMKRIADWDLYDKHYGPLLDGTAFSATRRGPRPIPYVYLPINPEWPASFLWWGEPGYETEFVNVVRQMEEHFRSKGWTHTVFEMFFNHKKRYKAFPWDGDEVKFSKDNRYFLEYGRLLQKALPPDSPVKFRFRSDSSWTMQEQFRVLAGVVNFWVLGNSEFSWYKYAPQMLKSRGDIVFVYGGTPTIEENSGAITFAPFQSWIWGIDGYVRWLTTSPGPDPWFHSDGGGVTLVYPGERFGIEAPMPSIRLKLQRNCVQDLTLLESLKGSKPTDFFRNEAARRYNASTMDDWWPPKPAVADLPGEELTNTLIEENSQPLRRLAEKVNSRSWLNVRGWILEIASEAK